ncbi:all-trans retinoic acid-induced differentiation factor-like [Physella acuta]|uniref:all-trans retinoic acid-induced differentiation factor-like n=1 Tax=Physella acuta TaxID=109671 RepID=UPI0027DE4FE5|nr:all-trans retinoic acid-induced differentiation factor-like [Physella acuta]
MWTVTVSVMSVMTIYFSFFGIVLLFSLVESSYSQQIPSLCNTDCKVDINTTETYKVCHEFHLTMEHRCCINRTQANQLDVVGIDLRECSITQEMIASGLKDIHTLQYISLEGNNISALANTDFQNNPSILYLSLPSILECPGGKVAWESVNLTDKGRLCLTELNPCQYENVSCPVNSHCEHYGIDLFECLCDEGYYGYKCMNQGTFPAVPFAIGLSVSTFVLCIFLWVTQRRYVISKASDKKK